MHFSDGVPVTVDDIIFSYETVMNPGVDAARMANYYKDIKQIVKVSEREVRFEMSRQYFKAVEIAGLMDILPKHNDKSEVPYYDN